MTTAAVLVGVVFFAGLIEFLAEQTFGQFISGKWMKLVAVAFGLAVALIFKIGMIRALEVSGIDMATTAAEWADYVLTGLLIGAGSTGVHDFFAKYVRPTT